MTHTNLTFNFLAMAAAIVAAFIFGGLWYGPLFGKTWARMMGFNMEQKPDPKVMRKAFALQILGTFLVTYIIAHTVQVWRPSVWGVGSDGPDISYGFMCGFFTWIGF